VSVKNGIHRIDTKKLSSHAGTATLLFELLRDYGFNRATAAAVFRAIGREPGRIFLSPEFRLVNDRGCLLISPAGAEKSGGHAISSDKHFYAWEGGSMSIRKLALTLDLKRKIREGRYHDPLISWLEAGKVAYPLLLRTWKNGDSFHPLGMKARKKLSDFFTDRKYSLLRKQNTWLLLSGGRIAWVVGERIDDRFRIDDKSQSCLELFYEEK
jgi:tRNA(Ile)-lysidine synthase